MLLHCHSSGYRDEEHMMYFRRRQVQFGILDLKMGQDAHEQKTTNLIKFNCRKIYEVGYSVEQVQIYTFEKFR